MGFNRETRPAENYDRYYTELSKYVVNTSPCAPIPRLPECAEILARLIPHNAAILDVGCGSGGFLESLRKRGFTSLAGLDPTPECIRMVREDLGFDARVGTIALSPFPLRSFDLTLSTVVFEHLLNPGLDVDKMADLLKPGGMAFILVPDASRFAEFMVSPFQDMNVEHINHFSQDTLNKLFENRGWERLDAGSATFTLTPTWQSTLIWGLYRKRYCAGQLTPIDPTLRDGLLDYIAKSEAMLTKMAANLRADLAGDTDIMLWGAGHLTSQLLASGALEGKRIKAVIDSNPNYAGKTLAGAPVGNHKLRGSFSGPIVVATVREQDAVISQIKQLGWPNRLVFLHHS
jgi:SAM-dependent methyltransferase